MLYAIVDIETTGGYASGNGITEIAIVVHDGMNVVDFYETLVNPQQPIPLSIRQLTGITNEMVRQAPVFATIAPRVYELLHDKVFIAHNVNFDYSFVKHAFANAGYEYNAPKLCTVRLSRKIVPGHKSYGLGKLCAALQINHSNQHRAGGDALATASLFSYLMARDAGDVIRTMLKGRNSEQYLPPNLPAAELAQLPYTPGVYYFYNRQGKIIYIGKAKNLRQRVKSHFSNNKVNRQKQDFLRDIHHLSYTDCATELMAHILESVEIRKIWPLYNRSQKGYLPRFGLYVYEDRKGYKRLIVEKNKNLLSPLYTFNTLQEGRNRLREIATEFNLCTRLCHIGDANGEHTGCSLCEGTDTLTNYNQRVDTAIDWLDKNLPTFALVDEGRNHKEQSCILIQKGNVYGMGYITTGTPANNLPYLQEHLERLPDNDYIRNLVYKHVASFPEKMVVLAG